MGDSRTADGLRAPPAPGGPAAAPPAGGRRLETVLRHSSDAVVLCDADGRVTDCNDVAEQALTSSPAEPLAGRSLLDLLPERLRPEVAAAWERLVAGDEFTTAVTGSGTPVRVHLGAVVHHERFEGAVVLWRTSARPAGGSAALGPSDDLRRGIGEGELRLHYQPIVALSGRPVASEALVRWQHPHRGLVGPAQFIDVAERTGLIVDLGTWVLGQACATAADWAHEQVGSRRMRVTVNLSTRQLGDDAVVASLHDVLERTGCPPEALVLEVTETAVMADLASAVRTLTRLKDLGVGLAIDDFGTGYSSLLYLKHFPVDSIKIDRSFVAGLGRDPDDTAIVAATVSLAHSVDVQCVAEGVETVEHLDLLRDMGCDFAQGFLFSRPLELPELRTWLALHLSQAEESILSPGPEPLPREVQRLLHQGASLHTIAASLNAQGSRSPRGTRWSARSVAHLVATHRPDVGG